MHLDIVKFDLNDANKIFDKLKNFFNSNEIEEWKSKLFRDLNSLFIKYNVSSYQLNQNSYMGIVLDCKTKNKNEIYIKIVPPMTSRYKYEVETLKLLPCDLVCEIYEFDYSKNAIVMEKVVPGSRVKFNHNEVALKKLFRQLYNKKIIVNQDIKNTFMDFMDVVRRDYNLCFQSSLANTVIVNNLYNKFKEEYIQICNKEEKYLLHGDVYKNNILLSNNSLKIIDPLGFIAPFVMELVSICAYEMFYDEKNNYKAILDKFALFFCEFTDEETYRKALFCELVKVYIPSIYEANDNGIRANKWYEIISVLYPEKLI